MKKVLKITGRIVAILLVVMVSIPFLFSGKIEMLVKKEANKMLNAEFDFTSLDISLFKNFPKASLTLKDFWVKGINEFENDTLASAKELTATVNIMSLFKDSGYEIDQIQLSKAKLKAVVLQNGIENWNILKEEEHEDEIKEEHEDEIKDEIEDITEEGDFSLKIKKIGISDLSLIYDNKKDNQYAQINNLDLDIKGDLSSKHTALMIDGKTPSLTFRSGGIPLINGLKIQAKINLDADLGNQVFTFNQNEIQINAIKTNLDGWVAMKENDAMEMDLKLNTSDVGFKEVLSLIPAIYATNFKDIKTDGTASLTAFAKGIMNEDNLPAFDVTLDVKNAMFRYPTLPSGVDQIAIHANVSNPGGSADQTIIKLSPFTFRLANNPFRIDGTIATPMSDPRFNIKANGMLDLGKIKEVYPLEDMELNGLVKADIAIAGQSSYIEKELYDKIQASGTINLSNIKLNSKDFTNLTIDKSLLTFTPQFLKLSETTIHIGDNDITLDSQLNNYIAYIMKGETIKGSLNVKSNHLSLNDFTNADTESSSATADTDTVFGVVEVPKNIDFTMSANLKEVVLSTWVLKNVNGNIHIKDGKADMRNFTMNAMDGELTMNGYYSTQQIEHPTINANFTMNNLSFAQAYKELNMVQSLAPIFNSLEGRFSGSMNLKTELNESMEPIYPTLQSVGNLKTKDLSLGKVDIVKQLAKTLKQEEILNRSVKDMELSFAIKDGRLETKPFEFNMGDYNMTLTGTTGLDQTIDYSGKLKLPASVAKIEGINTLGFLIGGTFNQPNFKIDTKGMLEEGGKILEEKAKDLITKELFKNKKDSTDLKGDTVKKDIKEQVTEEVTDKIKDLFKKKKNK